MIDTAPDLDREAEAGYDTLDLRGLVLSGGKPYILIVLEDPETGHVAVTSQGFDPELNLSGAFREIADLIEAEEAARV